MPLLPQQTPAQATAIIPETTQYLSHNPLRAIILPDYHYLLSGKWYAATKPFSNGMVLTDGDAIDEVRVYPETAQLITYTYEPLIGITSQCDAANRITYYEYDGLGRLARIRDMDRNILKQYSYKYQGQPGSADVPLCTSVSASYTNKKTVGYTVNMTNTANGNIVSFGIAAAPNATTLKQERKVRFHRVFIISA